MIRVPLTVVVACVALLASPTVAFAQTYNHLDATGDNAAYSELPDGTVTSVATIDQNVDIGTIDHAYGKRTLTMTASVSSFYSDATHLPGVSFYVVSKGGWVQEFWYEERTDPVTNELSGWMGYQRLQGKGKVSKKCKRMTARFDDATSSVVITVPSSCVRSSKRIRIATEGWQFDTTSAVDSWFGNSDDGQTADLIAVDGGMSHSPPIKRGGSGVVTDGMWSPVSSYALAALVDRARLSPAKISGGRQVR